MFGRKEWIACVHFTTLISRWTSLLSYRIWKPHYRSY
jgi:hypothetical protein